MSYDPIRSEFEMAKDISVPQYKSKTLHCNIFNGYKHIRLLIEKNIICRADEWGATKGDTCYKETDMIAKEGYQGTGTDPKMMQVVEKVLDDLKTKGLNVQMLNITQLSEYRKEGHPSIYRKQWEPLTQEQISNPNGYADCIHWCLPGVPDVWNELLYAYIFNQ